MVDKWYGINAPFVGGNERFFSRQSNEKIIKNDLLQLIMTAPGDRIMRSDMGTPLRKFTFETIDDVNLDDLRTGILEEVEKREERVEVDDLIFETDRDRNQVIAKLYVHWVDQPQTQFLIEVGIQGVGSAP